jgi:hypothetical protein
MILPGQPEARAFQFERDTLAFANELVWQYRIDPATGKTTTCPSDPPPSYWHRCFVVVRAARQFFYHARFDPTRPVLDEPACRQLVRQVVRRNPRRLSPEADRVVIPGFDGLRAFSRAWEPLLKAECGAAWESYVLRSHWRMVFPITRRHQERMAGQLVRAFGQRLAPIVHLFRFPRITINHGVVLFEVQETPASIQFAVYDPNLPDHPAELVYDRAERSFFFPSNCYWAGGPLNVVEIFHGWLF